MDKRVVTEKPRRSKIKAWSVLVTVFGLLAVFALYAGPWFQKQVPIVDDMFTLIEEQDINANAYFYTDIEGSYDGERFLKGAIRLADKEEARLNIPFVAGVVCCILILALGYRIMPMD